MLTGRTHLAGRRFFKSGHQAPPMNCGRRGAHILLSKNHVAEDLEGEFEGNGDRCCTIWVHCEVKHGVQVAVVNLWSDRCGCNRQFGHKSSKLSGKQARQGWRLGFGSGSCSVLFTRPRFVAAFVLVSRKSARSTSIVPEKKKSIRSSSFSKNASSEPDQRGICSERNLPEAADQ